MLLHLLACTTEPEPPAMDSGRDSGRADGADLLPGDTAGTTDTADTGGGVADPDGCSALYAQDRLPAYDLEISAVEWASLEADYSSGRKAYHEATLHVDAESVTVMVRLKGNPNFSWFGDKMQFVLSFNEVDPDARFHGLRKTTLDASWYDSTVLRDRLSWAAMRARGDLPAACGNNATLSVNGEFYGVYGHIEYFDHEYLERAFGKADAGGTLWKYGVEPTANDDEADYAAIEAFWASGSIEQMEATGDVSQWVRAWAAETVLGDDDGYVCCGHNFYLYDHPTAGILFVPWDFDDTLEIVQYNSDPISGYGHGLYQERHFLLAMQDEYYRSLYVDEVEALNEAMDPVTLAASAEQWSAQIEFAVAADELRTWGDEERAQTLQRLAEWFPSRHAFLRSWVACERGSTADLDGDGLDVCRDSNDEVPATPEVCNLRDDDGNGLVDETAGCEDCIRHDLDARHRLYCSWPRTASQAQINCMAQGGTLAELSDSEDWHMSFFWTWPDTQGWWIAGQSAGTCQTWDEASFSIGSAPCAESHPSICALP
ncbi:MAG: hypothetical protein EXR71_17065 [Myxococcales bacterium]|nr:hypothetical protein [Myxococcales bacterium]